MNIAKPDQTPIKSDLHDRPFEHFRRWHDQARAVPIDKPHEMTLSTVDVDNKPSCRVVLLRSHNSNDFVFHTYYESRKGVDIARNPQVALTFWWDPLGYQVRIEGRAQQRTAEESDAYFAQRPRGSQLGTCNPKSGSRNPGQACVIAFHS